MEKLRNVFLTFFLLFTSVTYTYAPVLKSSDIQAMIENYFHKLKEQEKEKQLQLFLDSIAFSESSGNPQAYNKYGYIGKYQFGHATRKQTGFGHIKFWNFVKDPEIWSETDQDSAMIRLLNRNEYYLVGIISKYDNTVIGNDTITKSGILAAAHLAGATGVRRYFDYGINPRDAFGTSLEDYLVRFSGFNF